jgi:serine protease Do
LGKNQKQNVENMTKKILKILIPVLIGIVIGIILYAYYGVPYFNGSISSDSLLAPAAYASYMQPHLSDSSVDASRRTAITRAVRILSPTVVSVNVIQVREYTRRSPFYSRDPFLREFFPELFKDQRFQEQIQNLGSGFIISPDGYILTNAHVVEDASRIVIKMSDGHEIEADMMGTDPVTDIALLKIDMDNLPYAVLGNSDKIILGEWAIAIGNPFGLFEINNRATVTVGVVSALDRDFGEIKGRIYQDMIQTDASINTGNSGGPLSNALGEVIGMNTFIYTSGQYEGSIGIGFAIPINRIKRLLDDLKKYRKIDRDFWIGIKVQNLNDIVSRKMGYSGTDGVLIRHIDRESPAEKSGLLLGDIIIKIEDQIVHTDKDVFEVIYGSDLRVGDEMQMEVWRDGKTQSISMKLESIHNN